MIVTSVAEGLARNGISDTTKRWPNNEVIYFIQADHFCKLSIPNFKILKMSFIRHEHVKVRYI